MNFEIDYDRAKDMATRLQEFLAQNPNPKLSRSSSIEAVARMLGFNNRNEMAARMSTENLVKDRLTKLLNDQVGICAKHIVDLIYPKMTGWNFWHAIRMHIDEDSNETALSAAESRISIKLNNDMKFRDDMRSALLSCSEEFAQLGGSAESTTVKMAKAVVNESVMIAEDMWRKRGRENEVPQA